MTNSSQQEPALELLEQLRHEAGERVGRELGELRDHLIKCCEHTVERLRKSGFVSLESVTPVVEALVGVAASERERAKHFESLLKAAETELDAVRTECQAQADAARQALARESNEQAARLEKELQAAREAGAKAAEEQRNELAASRSRFQHVIDAQSLEIMQLRRELNQAARGVRVAASPATNGVRPLLTPRERLAENLSFDAIDAALSATPPAAEWPTAV